VLSGETEPERADVACAKILEIAATWHHLKGVKISMVVNDGALNALDQMQDLRRFSITNPAGSEAILAKHQFLRRLNTLVLISTSADEIARGLQKSTQLQRIVMRDNSFSTAFEYLADCPSLSYIELQQPTGILNDTIRSIAKIRSLKELYFHDTAINSHHLKTILQTMPQLKTVRLSGRSVACVQELPIKDPRILIVKDAPTDLSNW
jgi:hypothetical protein